MDPLSLLLGPATGHQRTPPAPVQRCPTMGASSGFHRRHLTFLRMTRMDLPTYLSETLWIQETRSQPRCREGGLRILRSVARLLRPVLSLVEAGTTARQSARL